MDKCFLDVDGVLADFSLGVSKLFEMPGFVPSRWNFFDEMNLSEDDFWAKVDAVGDDFWADLEPTPEFPDIISLVEEAFGVERVCLLTSPNANPRCLAGKLKWIKQHLPQYSRQYLMAPAKPFVGDARSLLIDDSDANVEKFLARGGKTILVPRKWNKNAGLNVVDYIRSELARMRCAT